MSNPASNPASNPGSRKVEHLISQPVARSIISKLTYSPYHEYIKIGNVMETMDQVFGPTGWKSTLISADAVHQEVYSQNNKDGRTVEYLKITCRAIVRITAYTENGEIVRQSVGAFSQTKPNTPGTYGNLYSNCIKSAESDAICKACSRLGKFLNLTASDNTPQQAPQQPQARQPQVPPDRSPQATPPASSAGYMPVQPGRPNTPQQPQQPASSTTTEEKPQKPQKSLFG